MRKRDLKHFARVLKEKLVKKEEYIEMIRGLGISESQSAGSDGTSVYVTHPADVSGDNEERERLANLLSKETEAVVAITEALDKIDAGTYGVCEYCGANIPKTRLGVVPEARFCVKCQNKLEGK